MKHKGYLCRSFVFGLLTCLLLYVVVRILTPKYYYDNTWPTTSGYRGFYQMEKDSVDVLILGSSCAASGFSPQVFYDSCGIKSYNLGCEGQSLLTSYYWLEEALRYQSPKAVLLETYFAFPYNSREPLNTDENSTRKAFDPMRWSGVKWRAVQDICSYDPKQTPNSYYFPNIRYHARWTELEANDFLYPKLDRHYELKGFAPLGERRGNEEYTPFLAEGDGERAKMVPLMEAYMDQIAALCKERGITLILTKLPYTECNRSKYNTTVAYAADHGIAYWDFNESSLYQACGFVSREDMNDDWHTNLWGAEKISRYAAKRLQEEYGITGGKDAQWEDTAAYYDRICRDYELKEMTEIIPYLEAADQEHYTILLAVKGNAADFMEEEVKQCFQELGTGLTMDYGENGSYYAAIHEGRTREAASAESLAYYGSTAGGLVDYEIVSEGYDSSYEGRASIKIEAQEYARDKTGINIVVYNNERRQVIDTAFYNGSLER